MTNQLNLLLLFFIFSCISGLQLPPSFQKCRRSDPKRNECLASAIEKSLPILAKGLPAFKFDSIEPVKIPSLTIGEGKKGAVNVVQNYKNVQLHNVQYGKFEKVESTITAKEFELMSHVFLKEITLTAQYNFNGSILFFRITGDGNCTIKLKNTKTLLKMLGEVVEKKDKKYLDIKTFTIGLDPENVEFDFENLFNGDPILGPQMNIILNDNWKDVFDDVKSGYEKALGHIFRTLANLIMKKVPYDELFPL